MIRHSSLKRGKPLRAKRKYKPVEHERFHEWIAKEHVCLVCGGAPEVHHVTGYADKPGRFSRSPWLVVPLCEWHHRLDRLASQPTSVQGLTHQGFYQQYGIDLLAEAMSLAEVWQRETV